MIKKFMASKWRNVTIVLLVITLLFVVAGIPAMGQMMHIQPTSLWEISGNETQMVTPDDLDMQNMSIINVLFINGVNITALNTTVATHSTSISDLQSRMTTAESDIDTLEGNVTNLQNNMTQAWSNISALEALAHTQNTDTGLGALNTKNPPIDNDKVIYRDSTDSDNLVTSLWSEVKAFLKTYFDTLYATLSDFVSLFNVVSNHTEQIGSLNDTINNLTINDLTNVNTASPPGTGDSLVWNGTVWTNSTITGGGGSDNFTGLDDTPASYSGYSGYGVAVNSTEDGLEYARYLLAPNGTAEWENRSFTGWEVVATPTTYTIGAGQDFTDLNDAADSLKGLILLESVTLQLEQNITVTSEVRFNQLVSAGGNLILDLNAYDITINYNGHGIRAWGPFTFAVRTIVGSSGTIKAGASASTSTRLLVGVNGVYLTTYKVELDANSRPILCMLQIYQNSRCWVNVNTVFQDTGGASSYQNAVRCLQASFIGSSVTLGVAADDFVISQGGAMVIDDDGHIHTEAGEFIP